VAVSEAPAGTVRRRRNREATRRAIVDAAFELFSRSGFARTSVRDIAAVVGVTDAALYHHFGSKKDLLDAVFAERGVGAWSEWVQHEHPSVPLPLLLERTAIAGLQFIEQHRDLFRLVLIESLAGDTSALAHHAGQMALWRSGIASLIARHPDTPTEADPTATADHLVAALWGIAVERLLGTDPAPLIDIAGRPTPRLRAIARALVGRSLALTP
jgi:AcrR family transcriptional regulator